MAFRAVTVASLASHELVSLSHDSRMPCVVSCGVEEDEAVSDDDDIRDAMLFRFWCKGASYPGGYPAELGQAIHGCKTPDEFRKALTDLARKKGVNLP
jgi:hypothetical protein